MFSHCVLYIIFFSQPPVALTVNTLWTSSTVHHHRLSLSAFPSPSSAFVKCRLECIPRVRLRVSPASGSARVMRCSNKSHSRAEADLGGSSSRSSRYLSLHTGNCCRRRQRKNLQTSPVTPPESHTPSAEKDKKKRLRFGHKREK